MNDPDSLTPNQLLHLGTTRCLPPGVFGKEDLYCRRAWRQAQYLSNLFWQIRMKEYLPSLMEKKKWGIPKENMKVGDLVVLVDNNYRCGEWPSARMVEVLPSSDGLVRAVRVKIVATVATYVKRPKRGDIKTSSMVLT